MINFLIKERPKIGLGWSIDSNIGYSSGPFPNILDAANDAASAGHAQTGSGQPGFVVFLDYDNASSSAGWITLCAYSYAKDANPEQPAK